ncbi:MAG: amidohydrolase [Gemmatimonadetes bacterium]|nr:amidohydrolase [Gemmatimonadota bacterium]
MRPEAVLLMWTDCMTMRVVITAILMLSAAPTMRAQSPVDSSLAAYIARIRAVDNHTHVNSLAPVDSESDALPLDGLPAFPLPDRLRSDSPAWIAAYRALYGYRYDDLSASHMNELRAMMKSVMREQGNRFPEWVLDRIGTEVMFANRIAMGPGLAAPRFRWVSYVDALMLPLSTRSERAASPDYRALYPLEDRLLGRYLAELHLAKVPGTLDAYLRTVVTPTLERQRREGCVAVKFEAAYLRALDFGDAPLATARRVYARYAVGGVPTHSEYKDLQDYLFRYIARESGRLGMAVHIHSLEGAGGFYRAAGSDPLLLEPAFNDSTLRGTTFVIVHGGGMYAAHTSAMFWKPNVYADISMMSVVYSPTMLAGILRGWLTQFPEKVLFGTDAFAGGPDAGWELAAWIGATSARHALAIALTGMMRDGEISRARAEEIAMMVMRGNAAKLYGLKLN